MKKIGSKDMGESFVSCKGCKYLGFVELNNHKVKEICGYFFEFFPKEHNPNHACNYYRKELKNETNNKN